MANGCSIQGNIRRGFKREHGMYVMLRFCDGIKDTRDRLQSVLEKYVTSACQQERNADDSNKNGCVQSLGVGMVGLSYSGYEKLGLSSMSPSDPNLGFDLFKARLSHPVYRQSDLTQWESAYRDPIDAFLLLANDNKDLLKDTVSCATKDLDGLATVAATEYGYPLRRDASKTSDGIEHFGFRDQVSRSVDPETMLTRGDRLAKGAADEASGCFAVFMKLEQDVAKFNQHVDELADFYAKMHVPVTSEDIAARIVGRRRDGTPLASNTGLDEFDFKADPKGDLCPQQAHIRVMNPRDGTPRIPIVRRGLSFGRPLNDQEGADAATLPSTGQGLLFFSLQRSLLDFLGLMSRAVNQRDPLLSNSSDWTGDFNGEETHCPHGYRAQLWKVGGREFCYAFADVTTLRGGEFFYIPGMDFIRGLGSHETDPPAA
jgi:deferrochelatase/peroxidase EfeB